MVDTPPPTRTFSLARYGLRLFQRSMNAFGDKSKLRTSRHADRRSRMMGQYEDGRVIRRFLAPPALPAVIRPRPSDRTEHVSPKNPGPESGEAELRDFVVDARLAIHRSVHPPPDARVKVRAAVWPTPGMSRTLLRVLVSQELGAPLLRLNGPNIDVTLDGLSDECRVTER